MTVTSRSTTNRSGRRPSGKSAPRPRAGRAFSGFSLGDIARRFRLPIAPDGPPEAPPIVPEGSVAGRALTVVVAIMSFLACLTIGAVTLVADASREWQQEVAREITIQVKPVAGADIAVETNKAVAIARATSGVGSVTALARSEKFRLLEPWLGAGLDASALPIPQLIVVGLANPRGVDLPALGTRLAREVRGASLDDHRIWSDRLATMANATVLVGIGVLALVFAATVLSVVFATRGAMDGNRDIVSVMHFVGAEDTFVATEFQRHFLLLGLRGGLAGALLAALLFAALSLALANSSGSPESDQVAALFGRFAIGPTGYFGALGIAFLIAVMTAITSRITVHRYLADVN